MMRFMICLLGLFLVVPLLADSAIHLARVPDQGVQPVLLTDSVGDAHLIYFGRDDQSSDRGTGRLYHRRYVSQDQWSSATPISSVFSQGDAIGMAAAAIDENDRLHVVWLATRPTGFYYSRSSEYGFEAPRRIVGTHLEGVEAGAAIAVRANTVVVVWHAGDLAEEESRQVFKLMSLNGGDTFGAEMSISDSNSGVCGCCSLATSFLGNNHVVAYRSAVNSIGRHMQLLLNDEQSTTRMLDEWYVSTCPVSSAALDSDWVVFETKGRLLRAQITQQFDEPKLVKTSASRQKHPDMAINPRGEQLIVWGEADGYFSGGKLSMAMFDANGVRRMLTRSSAVHIPDFSVAAVTALDNIFLVVY
jgi:hypothetical protein